MERQILVEFAELRTLFLSFVAGVMLTAVGSDGAKIPVIFLSPAYQMYVIGANSIYSDVMCHC